MSNLRNIFAMLTIMSVSLMFLLILQIQTGKNEVAAPAKPVPKPASVSPAQQPSIPRQESTILQSRDPLGRPEVSLYFWDRTADQIGILFEDEEFLCRWDCKAQLEGYVVMNIISDYGEIFDSSTIPIGANFRPAGSFNPILDVARTYGPFQINAWMENLDRMVVSKRTFLRVNYIKKPKYWGSRARMSSFGAWYNNALLSHHFILAAKAIGLNMILANQEMEEPSRKFLREIESQMMIQLSLDDLENQNGTVYYVSERSFPEFGGIMDNTIRKGEFLKSSTELSREIINAKVHGNNMILFPLASLLLNDPGLITGVRPNPSADSEGLLLHPCACAAATSIWFLEEQQYQSSLSIGSGYVMHFFQSDLESLAIMLPPVGKRDPVRLKAVSETRIYDIYSNPIDQPMIETNGITYFWSSLQIEELIDHISQNIDLNQ